MKKIIALFNQKITVLAHVVLLCTTLACSNTGHAQFRSLLDKAKKKALGALSGKDNKPAADSSVTQEPNADTTGQQPAVTANNDDQRGDGNSMPAAPQPVRFPHTGVNTTGIHAVLQPDIDGDVQKIAATPPGKYVLQLARQKGLTGTDAELFKQLMEEKNTALRDEIAKAVLAKYPSTGENGNTPWGNTAMPSLVFDVMVGRFDIWITGRYVKTVMKHDHAILMDAFGGHAAAITDLEKRKVYAIGSVMGVNFAKVDSMKNSYGTLALIKEEYLNIKGVKIEPGTVTRFGDYRVVSEKITLPVRPYTEKGTGEKSDGLLYLHDLISGRHDFGGGTEGQMHYQPSDKLVLEYYFTHDLDNTLPDLVTRDKPGMYGWEGVCVGAAMKDENGHTATWKLTNIQTGLQIDTGEFQLPAGYPVLTDEQLQEKIREKFKVK